MFFQRHKKPLGVLALAAGSALVVVLAVHLSTTDVSPGAAAPAAPVNLVAPRVAAAATGAAVPVADAAAPIAPASGLLFGESVDSVSGQSVAQANASAEALLGRGLSLDRSYSRWDTAQPSTSLQDDAAHGRTPLLSVVPQRADGSKATWTSIASGAADSRIRAQADGLRDFGRPVILVFHHEADIAVGYGTAAQFVAAYRHYVSVVRAENAVNVSFGVVFVPLTFGNPAQWYPGDDVVDWIGTDAYNSAGCTAGATGWRTLAQAASTFYNWGLPHGKPMMLAEWGSAEDPNQPDRRAAWLRDAAVTLAAWPAVKGVAYFDHVGSCDWRLKTSAAAQTAFIEISRQSWANGAPSARLLTSVPIGAADLAETFDLASSTGAHSASGSGVTTWNLDFGDGTPDAAGTSQPTTVNHTYLPGHWTATLTVGDSAGGSADTTALVISAPAPVASEGSATAITATSATVPSWVDTNSLPGTYYVEWGPTTAYGARTATQNLVPLDYTQSISTPLSGLPRGTRCYWRIVATSAAGTTTGPARWFSTLS